MLHAQRTCFGSLRCRVLGFCLTWPAFGSHAQLGRGPSCSPAASCGRSKGKLHIYDMSACVYLSITLRISYIRKRLFFVCSIQRLVALAAFKSMFGWTWFQPSCMHAQQLQSWKWMQAFICCVILVCFANLPEVEKAWFLKGFSFSDATLIAKQFACTNTDLTNAVL